MIYNTTRASLLGSTRKLRYSFRVTNDSLKFLFRNQSTAAEILSLVNPSKGNPTATSSDHTGYINGSGSGSDCGDQCLGGFHQSLNPYVYSRYQTSASYVESSEILNQRHQTAGSVQSHTCWNPPRQGWDSCNGGQSQAWKSPNANDLLLQSFNQGNVNHFQQDHSGHGSSLDELDAICREGKVKTAVEIIKSWRNQGYIVDLTRLLWLAKLCGDAQALQEAKLVHEFITCSVSFPDISVHNSMIEMYSGCESVENALTVFNGIPEKNSQTWCAIIRCLAKNGQEEDAIDMFSRYKEEGNRPDGELFKETFFACGVLGDINEGMLHFESMSKDYGIIPCVEHYASLVKMLAEPGYLDEALNFVESMEANVDLWETLMNLSRVHGDLELGDRCQDMVEQLDASRLKKESKAGLVPVRASDVVKEKLQRMGREKKFGAELLIAAGDISRPENREFYMALKCLKEHMVEIGYVPQSKLALHDVDQESKDENLFNHTEKFAVIATLLNTPARSTIRVLKNLRVCVDCHNALNLMSKIVGRLLVSRDAKRFHHMKDGVCTCGDYW